MTVYCRYRVPDGVIFTRHCKMPAKPNGLCVFHQPEAVAKREAKRDAKRNEQHARFRYNSDVHEARQHVVEEAMRIYQDSSLGALPHLLFRACKKLSKLLSKGPTT